jgi:signal transduction histidine kinase
MLFLASGIPLAAPAFFIIGASGSAFFWLLLVLTVVGLDLLTTAQRSRLRALRGLDLPGRLPPGAGWWARLRSGMTWRQAAYHLVIGPAMSAAAGLVLLGWGVGLVTASLALWLRLMPADSPLRAGPHRLSAEILASVGGLALLFVVSWATAWLARINERVTRSLLGPNRAEELARRVEDLAESRAGVVDAADAERRRIERDLHDGAQQRLVSLAMNLGLALRTLKGVPPEAMQVIAEAHTEALAAIDELRDLVRGLHPVVLEDRGLDAALSGIAARSPVPVRLHVDLPGRLDPTVEAVAYFTVSEALTNSAKHSRASRVDLSIRHDDGSLRIVISDDGVGGADATRGTGLTGLRKRAASVDGAFSIISPQGGPTTITVELPCVL